MSSSKSGPEFDACLMAVGEEDEKIQNQLPPLTQGRDRQILNVVASQL